MNRSGFCVVYSGLFTVDFIYHFIIAVAKKTAVLAGRVSERDSD